MFPPNNSTFIMCLLENISSEIYLWIFSVLICHFLAMGERNFCYFLWPNWWKVYKNNGQGTGMFNTGEYLGVFSFIQHFIAPCGLNGLLPVKDAEGPISFTLSYLDALRVVCTFSRLECVCEISEFSPGFQNAHMG